MLWTNDPIVLFRGPIAVAWWQMQKIAIGRLILPSAALHPLNTLTATFGIP